MKTLKNIFTHPISIDGIDKNNPLIIYPIKLKDYDEFQECSKLLYISKNHFGEVPYPLLALLFMSRESLNMTIEEIIECLSKLFTLATQKEVNFISNKNIEGFVIDNKNIISVHNYDIIRETIMKQNLMFEQKVYKNKIVQAWANKVLEAKSKNQPKIGMEEIITTVSVFTGKHYWDLENYTIYQIYSDFYRIRKLKSYDVSTMARCQGADIEMDDFAEDLDIYRNPYDSLFVDSKKLNKFDKSN